MLEHHGLEKFDVPRPRRNRDIAWRSVVAGEDEDKAKFPKFHPFDLLASSEQPKCPSG